MKTYLLRIAAWLSQGLHCIALGGHHDMTLSARCYVEYRLRGNARWRLAHDAINWVFWVTLKQQEHCMASFLSDAEFARDVIKMNAARAGNPGPIR